VAGADHRHELSAIRTVRVPAIVFAPNSPFGLVPRWRIGIPLPWQDIAVLTERALTFLSVAGEQRSWDCSDVARVTMVLDKRMLYGIDILG
jgi:hypothetical protein